MEAESLLNQLCERHGVDPTQAERLLPLVRWALKGPDESKKRILGVVERALSGDPDMAHKSRDELAAAADQAILVAVARVLHDWTPEQKVLDLGLPGTPDAVEGEEGD